MWWWQIKNDSSYMMKCLLSLQKNTDITLSKAPLTSASMLKYSCTYCGWKLSKQANISYVNFSSLDISTDCLHFLRSKDEVCISTHHLHLFNICISNQLTLFFFWCYTTYYTFILITFLQIMFAGCHGGAKCFSMTFLQVFITVKDVCRAISGKICHRNWSSNKCCLHPSL